MESPLAIKREVLVNKILERALACESVEEAKKLYESTPEGLEAKAIYEDRYLELANSVFYSQIKKCTDINEVKSLCEHSLAGSIEKKICKNRLVELNDIETVKFYSNCKTISDVIEHFINATPGTLSKEIYGIMWMQFHLNGQK